MLSALCEDSAFSFISHSFPLQFWAPGAGIQRDVLLPKVQPSFNLHSSNTRFFCIRIRQKSFIIYQPCIQLFA
jgi:hypothetical protein